MHRGYIPIWRKITETSFYKIPLTCRLAIHLMIKANHKDNKFMFNGKEIIIKEGEVLTGRKILSFETGISERSIRTGLKNLENCGFSTSKTTNRFSIISLCNYKSYRSLLCESDQVSDQPTTNQRPANDQPTTTNNNYNNYKNEKNKDILEFLDYFNLKANKKLTLTEDRKNIIKKRLSDGYSFEQLKKAVDNFIQDDWPDRYKHIDIIYCIGKQRGKPDNLEKWLNQSTKHTNKSLAYD